MSPSFGANNQALHAPESRVWIPNIHLVIAELSGEADGQIRLKIAVVSASIQQVRRSDADQPLVVVQSERNLVVPVVLEFLVILCAWDMGKTTEEVIRVLMTNHPLNSRQVLAYPLRILETAEVGMAFTL